MAGTRLETVFSYAILALFSLAVVLPVGWLLLAATSPKANAGVDLAGLRPANFVDAWVQADFTTHLLNSLIICVGAVVITSTVTADARPRSNSPTASPPPSPWAASPTSRPGSGRRSPPEYSPGRGCWPPVNCSTGLASPTAWAERTGPPRGCGARWSAELRWTGTS